jgi:hypothetical protein
MSKAGDGVDEVPPPKGDASDGKTTPIDDTSKDSRVEQLSSELKQLKPQRKIDKLKDSRSRQLTSSSSSNEETDASSEEEVKGKRGRKGDKRSYNTTSFNYDNLPPSSAFTSVPVGKAPCFDGTNYTKWRYSMKMHLISLYLSVWTIAQSNETISSLKSSSGAIQDSYDVLQKTHTYLDVKFNALWSCTSMSSNNNEAFTSQVSVETCDEAIAQKMIT